MVQCQLHAYFCTKYLVSSVDLKYVIQVIQYINQLYFTSLCQKVKVKAMGAPKNVSDKKSYRFDAGAWQEKERRRKLLLSLFRWQTTYTNCERATRVKKEQSKAKEIKTRTKDSAGRRSAICFGRSETRRAKKEGRDDVWGQKSIMFHEQLVHVWLLVRDDRGKWRRCQDEQKKHREKESWARVYGVQDK